MFIVLLLPFDVTEAYLVYLIKFSSFNRVFVPMIVVIVAIILLMAFVDVLFLYVRLVWLFIYLSFFYYINLSILINW